MVVITSSIVVSHPTMDLSSRRRELLNSALISSPIVPLPIIWTRFSDSGCFDCYTPDGLQGVTGADYRCKTASGHLRSVDGNVRAGDPDARRRQSGPGVVVNNRALLLEFQLAP